MSVQSGAAFSVLAAVVLSAAPGAGEDLRYFDHTYLRYDTLLQRYVCEEGVEYETMLSDPLVSRIREEFGGVKKNEYNLWETDKRFAYLINAYNFYTLALVLENYHAIKNGIKDLNDPWDRAFIPFVGDTISLNYLEHDLLRKKFEEPRVHFALACASKGCPSLFERAYTYEDLDWQLDTVANRFLTDEKRVRIEGSRIVVPKIFEWYGGDFTATYGGYREFIIERIGLKGDFTWVFDEYDWSLNKTKRCR
jgi:hypothetical protein